MAPARPTASGAASVAPPVSLRARVRRGVGASPIGAAWRPKPRRRGTRPRVSRDLPAAVFGGLRGTHGGMSARVSKRALTRPVCGAVRSPSDERSAWSAVLFPRVRRALRHRPPAHRRTAIVGDIAPL